MKRFYQTTIIVIGLILNLSPTSAYGQACAISNLTAVPTECDETFYEVTINFDGGDLSQYVLVADGDIVGHYTTQELPITVGPFLGDDETPHTFIVYAPSDGENCQASITIPPVSCGPICGFSDAMLEFLDCQSNVTALAELDFDFQNVSGNAFDLFYENGTSAGSYLYQDLPVTLVNLLTNGNESMVLTVCDDNSDCCETFTFPAIDCNPNNCELYNLSATTFCSESNNTFMVEIDFDFDNPGVGGFNLSGNTINYGNFSYADLPITVGPLNANTVIEWEFNIQDSTKTSCNAVIELGQVNCPMPCVVENVEITLGSCLDNTTYSLSVDADISSSDSTVVNVFSKETYLGTFLSGDFPVEISEFPGTGNFQDEITICGLNEDLTYCCETVAFNALLCAGCVIYNPTATPQPCDENGDFEIVIDFDFQNEGSQGFQLGGNGQIYGQFNYADLPITLGPFDADDNTFYEFLILDLENIGCLTAVEVGTVDCDDICNISNIAITELACAGANTYSFELDFDVTGTDIVGFDLYANGELFNFISADNVPLEIINFPASGNAIDTLTIRNHDDPQCVASIAFDAIDCALPCSIDALEIDTVTCESDSIYRVVFDFNFENTDGNIFSVTGNGIDLGTVEKNDGSVVIENFPIALIEQQELMICAVDDMDCCASITFFGPICTPDPCDIRDMEVVEVDCDSDSTFVAVINFISENTTGNLYDIYCDTALIATLEKDGDSPLEINGLPIDDTGEKTIRICANDIPNCCDQITILTPDCTPDSCEINIISIFSIECITDSTFRINVNMDTENTGTNLYDVYSPDGFLALIETNDGSFSIPEFPTSSGEFNQIIVCRSDDLICCDTVVFEGLVCDPELCLISDVIVETSECTSDSTFNAILDFNFQNTGSDTFDLFGVNGFISTIVKGDSAITLENFTANTLGEYVITICATDVNDCCADRFFDGPVCTSDCIIFDLDVDVIECTSPTTYNASVSFDQANISGEAVNVFVDSELIGTFDLDSNGIEVNDILFDGSTTAVWMVCDTADMDCCASVEVELLNCAELFCAISNLDYELSDCDTAGNFFITLEFDVTGAGEFGFNILGNGINYGTFPYSENPVTLGPLLADTLIEYEFLVSDVDNNACFDFVDVGVVVCEPVSTQKPIVSEAKIFYVDGVAYFELESNAQKIEIFGYDGKLIYQQDDVGFGQIIPLSEKINYDGVYLLRVQNEIGISVGKFIR